MSNTGRSLDGPDTSTDGNVVVFDGTSGDKVRDGGPLAPYRATVSLTDDEIIHLPSTAKELVGTAGSNKTLIITGGLICCDTSAADYGGIDDGAYIWIGNAAESWLATNYIPSDSGAGITLLPNLLSGGLKRLPLVPYGTTNVSWGFLPAIFSANNGDNQALALRASNGANFTGGDPANSMTVSLAYYILNTVTGEFE